MATASSFSVRAVLDQAGKCSKAELERRVEESEMKIKSLETQLELRDRESAVLAVMKYLLSPIYAMPAELLAEIFECAIDEGTHIMDVFRVSQVCSDWRQVAHNTPQLWTGPLYVALDNKGDKREQAHTDVWKAWLARSAALSIPITLGLESADIHHDLLGEVLNTAFRWRSLQLDLPDHGLLLLRRVAQHGLDSLEELDIEDRDFLEPLGGVIPSFTTAPRLRKLKMSVYSSPPILVPWANLTDLTLRHCTSPDVALDVLAQCLGLTRLSVRTLGWPVPPLARQDTFTFTHLHALSFALFGTAKYFTPLFANLSVSALQKLCLNFGGMQTMERWTEAPFTAFQLQAPNITRLDLQYADLSSDAFRAVLLHAPSLTHLKLFRCSCFDDAAMTALRYKEGITPLVPHLHNLVLEGMLHRVTDSILAEMIASRWWINAALVLDSLSPAVACWTHVELWYDLSGHSFLKDMPSDILMTSTRSYPIRDHFLFG